MVLDTRLNISLNFNNQNCVSKKSNIYRRSTVIFEEICRAKALSTKNAKLAA